MVSLKFALMVYKGYRVFFYWRPIMKFLFFFVFIFNILHRTAGADGRGGIGERVMSPQTGSSVPAYQG